MQQECQKKSTLTSTYLRRLKISHFSTLLSPNFRIAKLIWRSGRPRSTTLDYSSRATDQCWLHQQSNSILGAPSSAGPTPPTSTPSSNQIFEPIIYSEFPWLRDTIMHQCPSKALEPSLNILFYQKSTTHCHLIDQKEHFFVQNMTEWQT